MGEYEFYSEGFFGYGDVGDFRYGSIWHILPILLLFVSIFLVYRYRQRLADWRWEGRFRFLLAFVMLMVEMSFFWRLLYVGDEMGVGTLMTKLPLQVCQWALFCAVFMITSKNDTLFGMNFFLSLTLGLIPLLMPTVIVRSGPGYYRYYQFWLEHCLPIFATAYMMCVHRKRPRYRHLWLTMAGLMLLSVPAVIANSRIPGANYLYLGGESHGGSVGKNIAQLFPESQTVRYICFFLIVLCLFHASYGIYLLIRKRRQIAGSALS